MGKQNVHEQISREEIRAFTRALLEDVRAFERIVEDGLIESGVRRIGVEQEMFLIDHTMRPALVADRVLDRLNHPQFTTELGLFNLEVNLNPYAMGDDCLWRMEQELEGLMAQVRRVANVTGTKVLLTGILPTMKQKDLTLDAMTPVRRYRELNRTMVEARGGSFNVYMKGLDELQATHDNVMFEACNTSFQIHFQVGADEFPALYNLAQAIAAPVLAAAVNSPVFLQHRLWSETRVALFQQSLDTRSGGQHARPVRQRVDFGDHWVDSAVQIFKEDIARFKVLVTADAEESPLDVLDRGALPRLAALCIHNGTIYRWNRPCYGVRDGRAHLRIEHRALPAGPSVIDEMANAAFFFGLMVALGDDYGDITKVMNFDDAKNNFFAAARYGLQARLRWIGGKTMGANRLTLEELVPKARAGLKTRGIRQRDIDRYIGVIEKRVESGMTGSQWALDSLAAMEKGSVDQKYRALTASMLDRQLTGNPVHTWGLADPDNLGDWRDHYRTVEQIMTSDLFTVDEEDLVDLAANLMDWEHIRHVPVEDSQGHLVGLVSHRAMLRLVGQGMKKAGKPVAVREIMKPNPVTVTPETSCLDAIEVMRSHGVGCLPVVTNDNKLVGIVTEFDFIDAAAKLFEEQLREG